MSIAADEQQIDGQKDDRRAADDEDEQHASDYFHDVLLLFLDEE